MKRVFTIIGLVIGCLVVDAILFGVAAWLALAMALMRWLQSLCCDHAHAVRERRQGVLWLVCACGHEVEAIARTSSEP